jgi:hypothetical protein
MCKAKSIRYVQHFWNMSSDFGISECIRIRYRVQIQTLKKFRSQARIQECFRISRTNIGLLKKRCFEGISASHI